MSRDTVVAADVRSESEGRQTCRFRFQSDMADDDIVSATFGVYIRRAARSASARRRSRPPYMATWVLVYALRAVAPAGRPPERRLVHRRRIYLDDRDTGRWHHFRFLSQVRRWIANPHSNHGLFVQATDSRGEPLAVVRPASDDEQPYVSRIPLCYRRRVQRAARRRVLFQTLSLLCCRLITET